MMKQFRAGLAALFLSISLLFSACDRPADPPPGKQEEAETNRTSVREASPASAGEQLKITSKDTETSADGALLLDFSADISAEGVTTNGDTVTITAPGTYRLTGKAENRVLRVDLSERGSVHLLFDGFSVSNTASSPVQIVSASKVILTLVDGTENTVSDLRPAKTTEEEDASDFPDAAIWSKEDLTVNGSGTLTVSGGYGAGIVSKDVLKLLGCTVSVTSSGVGIKGKDALLVQDAAVSVTSCRDGLKSTEAEKDGSGIVSVTSGTVKITAKGDGISASKTVLISGGTLSITSGTYSAPKSGGGMGAIRRGTPQTAAQVSTKGIKSDGDLRISGGTLEITSGDDTLHCATELVITGGDMTLTSADDGIHSDDLLQIDGGTIDIKNCYEGLEAKTINLFGGRCTLVSADDGINASGGNSDGGGMGGFGGFPGGGRGGMGGTDAAVNVTGGFWYLNAAGDGFDSNGTITMSGGTMLVCGPTDSGNGAIDYETRFDLTGGILVASGSSGMAMSPSDSSTQCSVMLGTSQNAGTAVTLRDENGKEILTFVPAKSYQNIVISAPSLTRGAKITAFVGTTPEGEGDCGLYFASSGGTSLTTLTLSSVNTSYGTGGSGFGPGGKPGGPGGDPGRDPGARPGKRW